MRKTALFVLLLTALLFPAPGHGQGQPLKVVATFSILGDFVKQVSGNDVEVRTLAGPDSDTHTYKPTPGDAKAIADADIVVENGLGMEGWIDRLISASGFKGKIVIATAGITPYPPSPSGEQAVDPHAWQDVSNARIYVRNIANALAQARPGEAVEFQDRAKTYDAELQNLDIWVRTEIDAVPLAQRKIITNHDAFGYFGAAYGVTFLAPQGLSTEVEPTAMQVAQLIRQMKAEKVKHVFFENMASPKLVKQLASDAGASIAQPVYSDALSGPDGPAPTYISMFRYNVPLFKDAMLLNGQ